MSVQLKDRHPSCNPNAPLDRIPECGTADAVPHACCRVNQGHCPNSRNWNQNMQRCGPEPSRTGGTCLAPTDPGDGLASGLQLCENADTTNECCRNLALCEDIGKNTIESLTGMGGHWCAPSQSAALRNTRDPSKLLRCANADRHTPCRVLKKDTCPIGRFDSKYTFHDGIDKRCDPFWSGVDGLLALGVLLLALVSRSLVAWSSSSRKSGRRRAFVVTVLAVSLCLGHAGVNVSTEVEGPALPWLLAATGMLVWSYLDAMGAPWSLRCARNRGH